MALRVGVVGCRGIGTTHATAHKNDELAELVAVCDVVKSRADELAAKLQVKAYYSLDDMLANEQLDIVDVCTGGPENGGWHGVPVMQALSAGKHVLCEKPISNDVEEARQMVALAAKNNLYLGVNLNHYFTQPADDAKKLIAEDKIGEIIYLHLRMGFPGSEWAYARTAGANMEGYPYFHVKAFLAHPFSIMRYFGGNVAQIQSFMSKPSYRIKTADPMVSVNSIHLKFENGAIGYMFSSRGDTTNYYGGWWSIEVGGTKGTFAIENCVEKLIYQPGQGNPDYTAGQGLGKAPEAIVTDYGVTDFGTTYPRRIHCFLEDVTNGVPKNKLRASGRDALATLEYTFAAIDSFEHGGILVNPHPLPFVKPDPNNQ
jgi:predicted dehydrogenase